MKIDFDLKREQLKIRSLLKKRESVTSEGITLPSELIVKLLKPTKDIIDLKDYVNEIPVDTPTGKVEFPKATNAVMVPVEELEGNPQLQYPEFLTVSYDVVTYRGTVPVSQEMIDDAPESAEQSILKNSERQALNTRNKKIVEVMKTFEPKTIATAADLKQLLNKDLGAKYSPKLYVSESGFDYLDQLKDDTDRYIVKENSNGVTALRRDIIVLPDEVIGLAEGDKVGFIGDLKEAIAFFNRKEVQMRWANGNIYGEYINTITRFDVKKVDVAAGYYVTFDDTTV